MIVAQDKEVPAQLEYEQQPTAKARKPLVHESHKIAIGLGALIAFLPFMLPVLAWHDGNIRSLWRSGGALAEMAVFVGAMFASGAVVIWLGYRSGRRSRAAAHCLCGVYLLATLTMLVGASESLMGPPTKRGDDAELALAGAVIFSGIAAWFLWLAWAQWAWARHIAADREA